MIKFENTEVVGWEAAIRGMRNPMNSWERSDTKFCDDETYWTLSNSEGYPVVWLDIGPNDHDLMMRLAKAGTEHAKYRRMIVVYVDITAPLYWWKEFDTYKVGTVANSCSTMHKIAEKEFTLENFSCEHLYSDELEALEMIIRILNARRQLYLDGKRMTVSPSKLAPDSLSATLALIKSDWWQMIQLLPSSYNQRRTVMLNYEVLANIYRQRQGHKLDEWRIGFMRWIESLPYSEIITGKVRE